MSQPAYNPDYRASQTEYRQSQGYPMQAGVYPTQNTAPAYQQQYTQPAYASHVGAPAPEPYGAPASYPPAPQPYYGQQAYAAPPPNAGTPMNAYVSEPSYSAPPPAYGSAQVDSPPAPWKGAMDFSEKAIRMAFIRKVYAILSFQLLVTCGIICLFLYQPKVKSFVQTSKPMFWSAWILSIVCVFAIACFGELRRRTPHNFILLSVFTLCEGYLLGVVSSYYEAWQVLAAAGICVVVTLALTIFAFQTKYDFTMMGGMLFVATIVLICFGIMNIFIRDRVVHLVYSALGALIFSLYIVFDTQLMLGGKHKFSLSPEEYIYAALNLYLDIVNLFLFILSIIGGASRD
eukprot:Colp12_sorted_trinity150504_noHs@28236